MSDKEIQHNRRCTDCFEHSGIATRVEAHARILQSLDSRINALGVKLDTINAAWNNRLFNIMTGILLCLATGVISIFLTLYTIISQRLMLHEPVIQKQACDYVHAILTTIL